MTVTRRKAILSIICSTLGSRTNAQQHSGRSKWNNLLKTLASSAPQDRPYLTLSYLNGGIRYRLDDAGHYEWSSPETTLSRGYGDCSDFACAAFLALEQYEPGIRLGYCEINSTRMPGSGVATETHLVVMLKRGSLWYVIDQRSPYAILPIDRKTDLKLIYSWNRQGANLVGGNYPTNLPPRIDALWSDFLRRT